MNLLIVIVNYRTPKVTLECLASLAPQMGDVPGGAQVILVDNASGDDSLPTLEAGIESNGWKSWITLIASKTNTGFAGGNNRAMDKLLDYPEANYVLLLNSDTVVKPNVLKHCYDRMQGDESIGVMSCMLLNPDETVQNTARKLPTPLRLTAYSLGLPWSFPRSFFWADLEDMSWDRRTQARDVDWVGGAFMFIRRKVIDKIGGLDTRFFFYGEDAEFCRRTWKNHWRVFYDPAVSIVHLGGASGDPSRVDAVERDTLRWEARYLLQRRCYGIAAEFFVRGVDITSFSLRYLKLWLRGQRDTPEFAAQRDVLAMLLRWPAAAAKR
jgi:GT2 family glycosyltransferase